MDGLDILNTKCLNVKRIQLDLLLRVSPFACINLCHIILLIQLGFDYGEVLLFNFGELFSTFGTWKLLLFDVASDLSLPIGQIVGGRKPEMYLLQLIV